MTIDTIVHLLLLAKARRAQITNALTYARTALQSGSPSLATIEAEQRLNDQAITELDALLVVLVDLVRSLFLRRRNCWKRCYIVQLWIDPAAFDGNCPADQVTRVTATDPAEAGQVAFARFPDCAVADVYGDTKGTPFHGTQRVAA